MNPLVGPPGNQFEHPKFDGSRVHRPFLFNQVLAAHAPRIGWRVNLRVPVCVLAQLHIWVLSLHHDVASNYLFISGLQMVFRFSVMRHCMTARRQTSSQTHYPSARHTSGIGAKEPYWDAGVVTLLFIAREKKLGLEGTHEFEQIRKH